MNLTFSDQTCLYDLILHGHGNSGEMLQKEKKPPNLYYHEYKNLKYNTEYSVAVRGLNTDNERLESDIVWEQFKISSCMEIQGNKKVCGPDPIGNLTAKFTYLEDDKFDAKIMWNEMKYQPEFFLLEIKTGRSAFGNGTGKNYNFKVGGVSWSQHVMEEFILVISYFGIQWSQGLVRVERLMSFGSCVTD